MASNQMTTERARRVTINHVRDEDDARVFVMNNSMKIYKKPTHVLLPHTSALSGDTKVIEIPMTWLPYDLSVHAVKEDLMRNSELMEQVNKGMLQFVLSADADAVLQTAEGQAELDRLESARMQRAAGATAAGASDESFRAVMPPGALQEGAKGDVDMDDAEINPSVMEAVSGDGIEEAHRGALLRNLLPVMTEKDKAWVRGKSGDPAIRALVG